MPEEEREHLVQEAEGSTPVEKLTILTEILELLETEEPAAEVDTVQQSSAKLSAGKFLSEPF